MKFLLATALCVLGSITTFVSAAEVSADLNLKPLIPVSAVNDNLSAPAPVPVSPEIRPIIEDKAIYQISNKGDGGVSFCPLTRILIFSSNFCLIYKKNYHCIFVGFDH